MKHDLDKSIKDLLTQAGWSETRKVDRSKLIELITENNYDVLPKAIQFLEEFNGLIIKFTNLKNGGIDDITLDFNKATELEYPERIHEDYEPRIGKKLCAIGTAYRDHFILVMDEDGKVYGGYDSYLVKIADTGIDAIEAIVSNKEFIKIQ